MFERLLKGMQRPAALGELLFGENFLAFELGNAFLIGRNHRTVARIVNAIEELVDLLFKLLDIARYALGDLGGLRKAHVPCVMEHRLHQREHPSVFALRTPGSASWSTTAFCVGSLNSFSHL